MNVIDILIVISLLVFVFIGFKNGFIRELSGLLSVIFALLFATIFMSNMVALLIKIVKLPTPVLTIIGFLIIFIIVYVGIILAGKIASRVIRIIFLGWLDRLGGSLFGCLKGMLFISVILYVISLIPFPDAFFRTYHRSVLVPPMQKVAPALYNCLKAVIPGTRSFYQELKQSLTNDFSFDHISVLKKKNIEKLIQSVDFKK